VTCRRPRGAAHKADAASSFAVPYTYSISD
jgi:hypothetical protein